MEKYATQVVALRKKGKTYRGIAKKLKVSISTVARILSTAQLTNGHFKKHKNGQAAYKSVIADVLKQGTALRDKAADLMRQADAKTQLASVLRVAHRASLN